MNQNRLLWMLDETADPLQVHLNRTIGGRTVSVVGNAASLLASRHGELIDSGCVLRMNAGVPVDQTAQGRNVDIHCFSARPNLDRNMQQARRRWLLRPSSSYFDRALSIWMSPQLREQCEDSGQLFYPLALFNQLADELGAPPSVGAMALHMLFCLTEAEVRVFGFDFKESPSFYRKRDNKGPHDWAAERRLLSALVQERRWTVYA